MEVGMAGDDFAQDAEGFVAGDAFVALGALAFEGVEKVDVDGGIWACEHPKEIGAQLAEEIC